MNKAGIDVAPISSIVAVQKMKLFSLENLNLPVSGRCHEHIIYIPIHPTLSKNDCMLIKNTVKNYFETKSGKPDESNI